MFVVVDDGDEVCLLLRQPLGSKKKFEYLNWVYVGMKKKRKDHPIVSVEVSKDSN